MEPTEALHKGGLREAPNEKIAVIEITAKMDIMVCKMHPLKIVIGALVTLHEIMVVEVPMVLPVI